MCYNIMLLINYKGSKMKTKQIITLMTALAISAFTSLHAQVFQVSVNDHTSLVVGDFAKNDMSNPKAGYVKSSNGGNLEFKLYIKKFGIGLRGTVTNYQRDNETYKQDLKSQLGISASNNMFTMTRSFWSVGGDLGVSYVINVIKKFQIEPYFYFGYRTLSSPLDEVVYVQNSTTFTYRKNPTIFDGISYVPGVKFHWNVFQQVGLNLYAEYEGVSTLTQTEETVIYSNESFEAKNLDRTFNPQSINIGLGISFSFGKGLKEN